MKILEIIGGVAIGAFCTLVALSVFMAVVMMFSMGFEIFTGIDIIRDYIRPFFGG
jgi:hypothetical protein